MGKESEVPFLLEDKLKELGAMYEKVYGLSEQTWTARKSIPCMHVRITWQACILLRSNC